MKKLDNELNEKLLFIDGHNITSFFYKVGKSKRSFWTVEKIEKQVELFVEATRNSNYKITLFYDFDHVGSEDLQKWMYRREKEVLKGGKNIPTNLSIILGTLLEKKGVEVHFTGAPGNDIILASYAQKFGASVLTRDRHLLMFKESSFSVYDDFELNGKNFYLHERMEKFEKTKDLLKELPVSYRIKDMFLQRIKKTKTLHMGCSSPLIKQMGNPYKIITPLRQAFYSQQKLDFPVEEVICDWDPDKEMVIWHKDLVSPDAALIDLLDKPLEAIEKLFKPKDRPSGVDNIDWENHLFGAAVLTTYLCSCAHPHLNFIDELQKAKEFLKIRSKSSVEKEPANFSFKKEVEKKYAFITKCKLCKEEIRLTQKTVDSFKEKGWCMPKTCKTCKNCKK